MSIPKKYYVNSFRSAKELNTVTISGYKKAEVFNKLLERIRYHDLHTANSFAAELVCSGHAETILNKIIAYSSQEININNPGLPVLLRDRWRYCKSIMVDAKHGYDPSFDRNKQELRNVIAEIVSIICLSTKKPTKFPKIGEIDFEPEFIISKTISRSTSLANQILRDDDPKELMIPTNELATTIIQMMKYKSDDSVITREVGQLDPYYWLAWLIEWDKHMTSRKMKDIDYRCSPRKHIAYDDKISTDSVWVIWDVILKLSNTFFTENSEPAQQIEALYDMFVIDYTRSKRAERKYLIYHAVQYLTNDMDYSKNIFIDRKRILRVQAFINMTYAEIAEQSREWESTLRRNKIGELIEQECPEKRGILSADVREEEIVSDCDIDDIKTELHSGGLIDSFNRPDQSSRGRFTRKSRGDNTPDITPLQAFISRSKDYEPVDYQRHAISKGTRDEPRPKLLSRDIECASEVPPEHSASKRELTSGSKKHDVNNAKAHVTKKKCDYPKCPDGMLKLPLNCTRGVGCMFLPPNETIKVINRESQPAQDIVEREIDLYDDSETGLESAGLSIPLKTELPILTEVASLKVINDRSD